MNYPNIKKYFEDNKVKIGSGAFGDVLKVIPKGDPSRPIAVKVINLQNLFDSTLPADKLEETLKNEIEILESLSKEVFKPKCFPVYYNYVREVSKSKEITYSIFFQYYPLSLSALIANKKEKKDTFETKTIYKYCVSLLNCLAFLQLMGICHRDLKPNNILLDDSLQNLILIDFGISENVAPKLQNFNTTRIQMQLEGTKSYFSPEMLEGFDNSDEDHIKINPFKADVFSFGIIFLEMILLQKLKNNPQKLKTDKQRLLRKLEDMRNQVEDKMEMDKLIGILNSCLEINPKDRPDFVTLFINSLKFIPGKALKFHILIEEARKEDVSKLFDKEYDLEEYIRKKRSFKLIKSKNKTFQFESLLVENIDFNQVRFTKELISEGSFGIVEKCFINSKLFAVKKLKPRIEKATLNKEIDFLNNLYLLTHKPKCFPKYYGCVIEMSSLLSEPTGYNLFFEYCEFDLRKKLNKSADKSLSFEMIKQYFHDLIRGFAFLQSKGWSHGDLKPDNFLIDAKNQIKIIDFGTIQKFNEAEKEKKYEFIGTDPYKSPEFVIADLNSEKKIYVNLFKSDVFSLGIIGLEMGGTYDSQNYEKTQTLNDFQAKITQCINAFENKFISEIEKNEDNKSFFLLLKSSLHMNSDIRGDFISLFSKILSVKDKIKLKYHVFVEDHDNFLYTKSQKNEKYLKEQNRIEIKKKCCQNCLKKVCSFLCETCIQGFINSIKKCVKSLCYRLFRCCQILCQGVKYIAELIKACCSGLGQGCQKYIELLKNDGEASFFFFMYTLFQIFCIVSFAIRVNFLVTDDFNKDLYFEMLPILSEAFLASIIIDVFLIIYLFIYIYGVIFGKKSSLLNFLFVAIKCIKIIVIIVIWVSDQAYPCPDEDWRNCNPEESEKLAQILRIRGIKTYDSLTICENLEKASLFICLYMVVLILCQE